MTPHKTGSTTTTGAPARRRRSRARSAPRGRPWEISVTPTSRTIRSGSSGPTAPPAAGPPISPRSSAAPRGPPRSPRTRSASTNSPGAPPGRPPAPSTARPRPSTVCAHSPSTGAGSIPCLASPTASARIPPPGLLRAPRIPRRPRPAARPVAGHPRPRLLLRLAQAGTPRPHLGRNRRGRRRDSALARALEDVGGTHPPHLAAHRRGPGATAGTPRPRQPTGLPPRRHRHPALAHSVAHRLPGGWGADPLSSRLPPHRRSQPDSRERPRARRHAPDRAQEPRHLRPI